MPGETLRDKDLIERTAIGQYHPGHEAAEIVARFRLDGDGLALGEIRRAAGGAGVKRLVGLGAIDAVQTDADLLAVVEYGEGIAVCDGGDKGLEGLGKGLGNSGTGERK
jgi:hypothetical protein